MEYQYWELGEAIAACDEERANTIALINNVPCILHLENQTGIKIFGSVIQRGLSRIINKDLYSEIDDEGQRFDAFFMAINRIVNTKVFGTPDNPSQWECPCDRTQCELGIICLDNMKTRKIVNSIDLFLDLCIGDAEKRMKWKHSISEYRNAMVLLRKKCDLTNAEIKQFQRHIDSFYVSWIELLSQEGVTNYIHMLGAGHIGEYLLHHRNLYKHSQQGWEAFNALLKTFFFRRTGRGGAGNKGKGKKSKIIPIARWLSRRMLWMMGYDFDRVSQELHEVVYDDFDSESNDSDSDSDILSSNESNDDRFADDNEASTI